MKKYARVWSFRNARIKVGQNQRSKRQNKRLAFKLANACSLRKNVPVKAFLSVKKSVEESKRWKCAMALVREIREIRKVRDSPCKVTTQSLRQMMRKNRLLTAIQSDDDEK